MNRRSFFNLFGMGIAGIALEQAIPFNRVWSFPTEIVIPQNRLLTSHWITAESLRMLEEHLSFIDYNEAFGSYRQLMKVGTLIKIKKPDRILSTLGFESPYREDV